MLNIRNSYRTGIRSLSCVRWLSSLRARIQRLIQDLRQVVDSFLQGKEEEAVICTSEILLKA